MRKYLVCIFFLVGILYYANHVYTNASGAPRGVTGALLSGGGSEETCATSGCHEGSSVLAGGTIQSNIPASGYIPGQTYTFTLSLASGNRFGFEAVMLRNDTRNSTGTLVNTSNTKNATEGTPPPNRSYVTHINTTDDSWSFNWQAPSTGVGPVTIYAAFNAADGTGGRLSDQIFRNSRTFSEQVQAPAAPNNVAANAVSASQVDISWNDNSNNEDEFRIERKTGSGSFTFLANKNPGVEAHTDNTVDPNTTYQYRVRAENSGGNSQFASSNSVTTPDVAPTGPSNVQAAAISPTRVDVTWNDNSDNEEQFRIERSVSAGSFSFLTNVAAGTESFTDDTVAPQTTYRYRVRAENSAGESGFVSSGDVTTPAAGPNAPTNLVAQLISSDRIDLSWSDNSNDEEQFRIERKVGSGGFNFLTNAPVNSTTFVDNTVDPNMVYQYRIRSENSSGESAFATSNSVSTTEEALQFTRLTAGVVVNDGKRSIGASLIDFDNDDDLDLLVINHFDSGNSLYVNNNGVFSLQFSLAEESGWQSSTWGDYDNDGDPDLFISNLSTDTNPGNNTLFVNQGATFAEIVSGDIVSDGGRSVGCSWVDVDNDGFLDVFVANRTDEDNFLYLNNGDGTFTTVTAGAIVSDGGDSYTSSWGDYDNDGDMDLYVGNASVQKNFLYENLGFGAFQKITSGAIVNDESGSFGSSWGDLDNNGFLDMLVINGNGRNNALYLNNGDGTFTKFTSGGLVNDGRNGRGSALGDYDNDGDLDIFIANREENNQLFTNNGAGTFTEVTEGDIVSNGGTSFGSVWGDFDGDGHLDLFVANQDQNNFLYMNSGNSNNWLEVKCTGIVSNKSAIGATVRVTATINGAQTTQMRQIMGETGRASQDGLIAHFGLGNATSIQLVRVEWPSGIVDEFDNVSVNQLFKINEGQTDPSAIEEDQVSPERFVLNQNYPNPFNPETTIEYELPARGRVTLEIVNMLGEVVRTLVDGDEQPAGQHRVVWDGRNTAGNRVVSGLYIYRIRNKTGEISKKLLLLK